MSWQAIVKDNNLDVSVIPFSETIDRLDAEYFNPTYLQQDSILGTKKLSSISDYVYISDGNHLSITEHFVEEGGVPYLRGQDVKNIFLSSANPMRISKEIYSKNWMKRSIFKPNDILLSIVGTVGGLSFVPEDFGEASGSCKIAILRPKDTTCAKVVMVFLLSKYGQYQLKRMTRGAVQMGIILEDIPKISIPIFSDRITSLIDGLISKALEVEKKSREQQKEAENLLLKEINLEKHTASVLSVSVRDLAECLQYDRFDAEYWQPEYDELEEKIIKYKEGFDTLDNLFIVSNKTEKIDKDKEYLYVELADVNNTTGTVDNFTPLKGSELPSRGRMVLKQNDLILSSVEGSLEKVAVITSNEKNIIGSTGFFVLKQKAYEPEVALMLLKSKPFQSLLKRQAQGTILTAIPKPSINRILLPKINKGIQLKIKELIISAKRQQLEAKELLEKAKHAVEVFIEKDEAEALKILK